MSERQLEILRMALSWKASWEVWWGEGWIRLYVPPWTARTFPG